MKHLLRRMLRSLLPAGSLALALVPALAPALVVSPVWAAPGLAAPVTQELLVKSGLVPQLEDLGPSLGAQLSLDPAIGGGYPEARLNAVRGAFRSAFATERLKVDARELLAGALSAEQAGKALDWLNSDLGKRLGALEEAAGKREGFDERAERAAGLFERLPQRRVERYERLARATLTGEGASTVAIGMTLATARGLAALDNEPAEPRIAAIRAQLEKDRPSMQQSLEARFVTLFAVAYESVEDRELDAYIAFAESEAGKAYHRALIQTVGGVMDRAGREASRLLASPAKATS